MSELKPRHTPLPWQTRFIYRTFQSARRHAKEDHLLIEGDAAQAKGPKD